MVGGLDDNGGIGAAWAFTRTSDYREPLTPSQPPPNSALADPIHSASSASQLRGMTDAQGDVRRRSLQGSVTPVGVSRWNSCAARMTRHVGVPPSMERCSIRSVIFVRLLF
jgi:hypothetical protein